MIKVCRFGHKYPYGKGCLTCKKDKARETYAAMAKQDPEKIRALIERVCNAAAKRRLDPVQRDKMKAIGRASKHRVKARKARQREESRRALVRKAEHLAQQERMGIIHVGSR